MVVRTIDRHCGSEWPAAYERHIRRTRLRNGAVFLFLCLVFVPSLGWRTALVVVAVTLAIIYAGAWTATYVARARADAGRIPRYVISRASATAIAQVAGAGFTYSSGTVLAGGVLRRDGPGEGDGWRWVATGTSPHGVQVLRIDDSWVRGLTYRRRRAGWLPEFGYLCFELIDGTELPMAVWDARRIPRIAAAENSS